MRFAAVEVLERGGQGVGEGDAEVVDGGFAWVRGVVDVVFVDADGVGEFEGREGMQMWLEEVRDVGEVEGVFVEELGVEVSGWSSAE